VSIEINIKSIDAQGIEIKNIQELQEEIVYAGERFNFEISKYFSIRYVISNSTERVMYSKYDSMFDIQNDIAWPEWIWI
jgi:hypothetical protein